MSLRIKRFEFSSLADDFKLGLKDYLSLYKNGIPLKNLLKNQSYVTDIISGRTPSRFIPEYWDGEYDFITMSDVDTTTFSLNKNVEEHITDEAIANEKNMVRVAKGSLLISNAMTIGLAFMVDRDVYINQNVFCVEIDPSSVNPKFLLWYFNCYAKKIFQNVYSSKYLSKQELSRVNIPAIDINLQNDFEDKIKPIETRMADLKSNIKPVSTIINEIFADYFHYNKDISNKIRKGMTFGTQTSNNTKFNIFTAEFTSYNNKGLRFSARSVNTVFLELDELLQKIGTIQLKDILLSPIHRGKTPEYSKNGSVLVIKTAHVSNNGIIDKFEEFVEQSFYEKYPLSNVKTGNILIASTGKPSLGKVDIMEFEGEFVADNHISIIDIDETKYNKEFLVYFLRSIIGYYQIERDFTGCTNQIELQVEQINNFRIPNISLTEQAEIVSRVKRKIHKQDSIKNEITAEREQINKILDELLGKHY